MSIQSTGFPLVLDANDFQRTDRGVKWGIKFHEIPQFGQFIYVVYTTPEGIQKQESLEDSFDIVIETTYGGDVVRWLKERLIPRINTWLAKMFPKTGGVAAPTLTKFEQAFVETNRLLKITVNADGTIVASV